MYKTTDLQHLKLKREDPRVSLKLLHNSK